MKKKKSNGSFFEKFASHASKAVGSSYAFIIALSLVLIWAVTGPFFGFSETWQLVINTGTTIITFLMVFLIQKSQNKDSLAIQLKLNELVASSDQSSNRLVDIESMTEEEMMIVQKYYHKLSELAENEEKIQSSHSLDEAREDHEEKQISQRKKPAAQKRTVSNSKKEPVKKSPSRSSTKKD